MSITYNGGVFHLQTKNTSYIMTLRMNTLLHAYYGKRTDDLSGIDGTVYNVGDGFYAVDTGDNYESYFSTAGQLLEYSVYGVTDKSDCAFFAQFEDGTSFFRPLYKSHRIYAGKPGLPGLPATYTENDSEADTLEITLRDDDKDLELVLRYSVFEDTDIITRNVDVVNKSQGTVSLNSAMSASIDFTDKDFDFVHLYGAWARERNIQKQPLMNASYHVDSKRGSSSHFHSPFVALARKNTTENMGEVYGFSFVYSGNFYAGTDVNFYNRTRFLMGINPYDFCWKLEPGKTFVTPEVVMTYSDEGYGKMSRSFHKLYRTRLVRGKYRDSVRPILLNNWEATSFNFDEKIILDIARGAKELGIEMLVLDDGWFGKRNDDKSSLGDWFENREKLPEGVDGLARKINDMGLKFGLWFEPEMISPDSELYRAHPDWCIHSGNNPRTLGRNQLILDLSRKDVCDYIKGFMTEILTRANIEYVKWDMNRNFGETGSELLDKDHTGEFAHRYMLGLYDVLEYITNKFPDVLFEGCSGGGGRFDAGMLYYFPQFWTSDDTDACERMFIQYGTSMVMPASSMGAHVSVSPNHQCGRITSLDSRAFVAMCGTYGYEMDVSKMTDEEKQRSREHIEIFKRVRDVIHKGNMYRLRSPFDGNYCAFQYVSEDKSRCVLVFSTVLAHPNMERFRVKFEGLDPCGIYRERNTGHIYSGAVMMNVGMARTGGSDFSSQMYEFERIK